MKVFIVGLGLMGASYAEKLKEKGFTVYGFDKDSNVLAKAENEILSINNSFSKISEVDLIILALYPRENILFIKENQHLFTKNQIITDLSGTKEDMILKIENLLKKDVSYLSHHPMAGRELGGYDNKDKEMFKNANFIIVPTKRTKSSDYLTLNKIKEALGFKKEIIVDSRKHDQLIALTSQLTHVIAVSLVNTDKYEETKLATGDSYRDLTRIAKINESMWSQLFLNNKDMLLEHIALFSNELNKLKLYIENNDKDNIEKYLRLAKNKRRSFDEN